MRRLIVAAATLNQTPLDLQGNLDRILNVITNLRKGSGIVCFPEMCITGYGCEDAFFYRDVQKRAMNNLQNIADVAGRSCPYTLIAVGLPVLFNNALYNVCALVGDGRILALIPKQNLCADGIHYETRWFKPWPRGKKHMTACGDAGAPFGDIIVNYDDVRVGVEICEDAWAADRPGVSLSQRGVDVILNPSASHFALGKSWVRKRFVVEGSRAFGCAYVFANLLGNEAGRVIYDGDRLIASAGRLVEQGERLTFENSAITEAVINVDENRTRRIQTASTKMADDVSSDAYMAGENDLNAIPEDMKGYRKLLVETPFSKEDKWDDFTEAVSLGLWDYMRKSRSNGFILSLSGGVDSTACAVLVREMIERAGLKPGNLMTCAYQATQHSSDATEAAARSVAEGLGFQFVKWDVDKLVAGYVHLVEDAIGRIPTWETDDVALQNIQARVRAPGVWMLANLKNALLLTTSNRSEAAVGYATMDGDTCGGLAPIAGIGKPFLIEWLAYMSEKYPCVRPVLKLKPSAELRPGGENQEQTDEDDLMPYVLLEQIQQAAIRDKLSPDEVYERLSNLEWLTVTSDGCSSAPRPEENTLRGYIDKFFTLWHRNQWKRERYAPAFHIDDESLDPKTWCRFPILSGKL